ncbi:MAG TPA: hypothetical protein VGS28_04170 [Candidatus Saccharimonadales bacterium]|nr:hypothetical protein [Candidatus Saccharimonadales bacterium]
MERASAKKNTTQLVVAVVIVVVVLVAGFMWWKNANPASGINTGEFQAIFLTNGQVYFGKLTDTNNTYVKMTDIYYLQVQQSVQPQGGTSSNSKISLTKLGNELHAPEDAMYIARDQVLFWENLKSTGKVVQAIDTYQAQHPGTQ